MTEVKELNIEEIVEDIMDGRQIILYNDDVNSFDHVILCLIKYCGHNPHQAEQCALIVHHKGKCSVKKGEDESLKPILEELLRNQLSAKIE